MAPASAMSQGEELVTELRLTLARMETQLENILSEAKRTNGRVTNLEEEATKQATFRTQVLTIATAAGAVGAGLMLMAKVVETIARLAR